MDSGWQWVDVYVYIYYIYIYLLFRIETNGDLQPSAAGDVLFAGGLEEILLAHQAQSLGEPESSTNKCGLEPRKMVLKSFKTKTCIRYIYIYVYTIYIIVYIYICIIYICTIHMYMYNVYIRTYVYVHVYAYVSVYIYICVYLYIYIYMYRYMYIYIIIIHTTCLYVTNMISTNLTKMWLR